MKTRTIVPVILLALTAFLPNASADHGWHECTDEDPCDNQGNKGCDASAGVNCSYEGHDSCYGSGGSAEYQETYCYHYSRDCLVNLLLKCEVHGSTGPLRALR